MMNLKNYENDQLMEYLLNVIEMLKKKILEEKDLPKLLNLLQIEDILKQEEQKVIAPLQGINGSSILTI